MNNFAPDHAYSFVVQTFPAAVRIDKTADDPAQFYFSSMGPDYHWVHHATMAAPGAAPKVDSATDYYGSQPAGIGHTFGGIPKLVTGDVDGDGLNDVQLKDERWVGYSRSLRQVVVKR